MAVYFNDFLITLLGISLTMSAVSALLMLLRRPMKKYFKAGSRFVIWALIMVRLCIPVGGVLFPSAVNIAEISKSSSVTEEDFSYEAYNGQDPDALIPEIESPPIRDGAVSSAPNAAAKAETSESTQGESSAVITAETVSTVLFAMWAAGAAAFILKYALGYYISAGYIKKSLREPDSSVKMLFDEICTEMKLKRRPRLAVSEAVDSPMLFGCFNPTVVMPDVSFPDEAARGIISHELTHYKRGDLYLKLVAMIGNAFHWFNPMAYIASKIFAREMELSCDEKVLMLYDDEMRVNYGRIMLGIVANCRKKDSPLTTGFNPRANAVKERISNILDSHAKHNGSVFISMTLALCISAGSLFGYNVSAYDGSAAEDNRRESGTEAETVYSEEAQSVSEPESAADTAETDTPEHTATVSETADAPEESRTEPPEASADAPAESEESTEADSREIAGSSTIVFSGSSDFSAETEMDQLLAESISAQVTPAESDPVETSKETDEQTAARQPHVHSYTVRKVNATCSANGRNIYRCSCGDVYTTIVYKTYNHDLHQVEKTFSSNGRQFTNCANICKDCGIEIIYRGTAGDGTTVSFYISGYHDKDNFYKLLDGELVIYGSGDMLDYSSSAEYPLSGSSSEKPPWYLLSKNYPSIRIAEGITSVGENAFADCCEYISSVTIGKTVTHIDANAFASGTNIETLYLPASLQSISAGAFCDSHNIHIKYEGTAEEFALLDLGDLSYASVEFNVEY